MTRFRVIVAPAADKELAAVRDHVLKSRLTRAIAALADNPAPTGGQEAGGGRGGVADTCRDVADCVPGG